MHSEGQDTHMWSPQDLTKDSSGYLPIPDNDYVKQYQKNPDQLWPVEFFLIVYRRCKNKQTQLLVRESANGTSKWGLGTGVPVTRWMLEQGQPPRGYQWSDPRISFEAKNFPQFPSDEKSWAYEKIDICKDAFNDPDLKDPQLEEYANQIRNTLKKHLSEQMKSNNKNSSWESIRTSLLKHILDQANSVAAIHGTLRMSGVFAHKESANDDSSPRYISLGKNAPDPDKLVQSMRVFTMFPQMPDPMPLPSTPPEELQEEIASRDSRMADSGRDPHRDKYGRIFTHKSTSNVSNTIHGVYLTLDATGLPGMGDNEVPPALDLFGTNKIKRQWKSLEDLKVLDGKHISTEDTKPTFISGFIVRQLVKEQVIMRNE